MFCFLWIIPQRDPLFQISTKNSITSSKIDPDLGGRKRDIEFPNMYKFMAAATYLDPYNIDAYYFTEAAFTWELGRIKEVNTLLERGLEWRTWDSLIPFFIGFNHFYFLRDFSSAARYMKITAERSKNPFYVNLAARFLYESDETALAIDFIKAMINETHNLLMKRDMEKRLRALEAVHYLENAVLNFMARFNREPQNLEELIKAGLVETIPKDPYGGRFYLDEKAKVRTTSKFAMTSDH